MRLINREKTLKTSETFHEITGDIISINSLAVLLPKNSKCGGKNIAGPLATSPSEKFSLHIKLNDEEGKQGFR